MNNVTARTQMSAAKQLMSGLYRGAFCAGGLSTTAFFVSNMREDSECETKVDLSAPGSADPGTHLLADGRRLAWREYGDPSGYPIFFFHGNLNSRKFAPAWDNTDSLAARANARVIAFDRPGYGDSTFFQGRTYSTWAKDVQSVARHLNIVDESGEGQFAVLGYSSGGPNAMAVASLSSHNVSVCGLVSSDGPYHHMTSAQVESVYGSVPTTIDLAWSLSRAKKSADSLRDAYGHISRPHRKAMALADLDHATKQGLAGAAQDSRLEIGQWDFEMSHIRAPVLMWHGTDDDSVPLHVANFLRDRLGAKVQSYQVIDGESHTLIRRHWQSILEAIVLAATEDDEISSKL